jgi:hypothetical protein
MKLPAALLAGTLALNAALIAMLALRAPAPEGPAGREEPAAPAHSPGQATAASASGPAGAASPGTAPAATDWASLDTGDLRELTARLRAAGFPEPVVRAVVSSRVEALFAPRMKELIGPIATAPIWQQDPRLGMSQKIMEGRNQLMLERTRMIRDALGTDLSDSPAARQRQFGDLPPQKVDLVQRISEDYAEMISQVRASTQGITLPEDREKLALLERERKADLAAVLTPEEFEAYEMRTSTVTARLRAALTVMDASEEEFRTIFRVYAPFNDRINPTMLSMGLPTNFGNERRTATAEMMAQMQAALPPDRFAAFERAQDRDYQQIDAIARQNNVSPDAAIRAFGLRDRYSAESMKLAEDRAMPAEQKQGALQSLVAEARAQILSTLGPKAGADYAQSANWLNHLENGRAFTVLPGGGMSMRPIVMPTPPPRK